MGAMASQITSLTIVYSTVYSGADQRKYQSSTSLVFVRGIHRWSVNSLHKWPMMRKMFPFDDIIMYCYAAFRFCTYYHKNFATHLRLVRKYFVTSGARYYFVATQFTSYLHVKFCPEVDELQSYHKFSAEHQFPVCSHGWLLSSAPTWMC